ncbi:HAD family hydrolase [Mycobacterium conspicuum]|jgi:HAD superfamily hydrolase (TIGR01509 family)|uniref:Haloacid dehalogenase n=1 Tax=Mycobacterium conspicuum TaxID=44010 RepID=A0A1X1TQF0_9MYCO|nr:HAD family hydrolase [Mycobacterium conspicuum]ORV46766.1 HAD family hydrolase [Mycobacterium conspicuum]BBZ40334.1 haloacid dehalogenase [Mycobacterium conspicuum]
MADNEIGGPPPAVLFDIDGTLVDSNYLHIHAWQRAFAEIGIEVETWRIHRSIGMDGSTLVRSFSDDAPDSTQKRLKDLHSQFYAEMAPLLRPLPGARTLLHRVADLGLQVVFATSAPDDELALLRKVLDSDDLVSAITSAADVDTAKPKPDIIHVALERAGVSADRAVFVGDAVWDAEACARAHVTSIGVLSGGVSRGELEKAGAVMVFENADDLLKHIDDTPIARLLTKEKGPSPISD